MCGIVGLYLKKPELQIQLGKLFKPMLFEMSSRGPDSAGVAIYWNTAVGPLSFIWGWPISEENYDKDNNFKFSIGTSF